MAFAEQRGGPADELGVGALGPGRGVDAAAVARVGRASRREAGEFLADPVAGQDGPAEPVGQRPGQRRLAGAWQAADQDDGDRAGPQVAQRQRGELAGFWSRPAGRPAGRAGSRPSRGRTRGRPRNGAAARRARDHRRTRRTSRGNGGQALPPRRSKSMARNAASSSPSSQRSLSSNSRQSRIRGPSARQKMSAASRSPCPSTMWPPRTRASSRADRPGEELAGQPLHRVDVGRRSAPPLSPRPDRRCPSSAATARRGRPAR